MSEIKATYLTAEGLEKLNAELTRLKTTVRKEITERIEAAKALGDLAENADYTAAKEDMVFNESRITEIVEMLKNVIMFEEGASSDKVRVGSAVEVEVNGKTRTYHIVGSTDANPVEGKISNESPLGNAFLGHTVGDLVRVETPAGLMGYTIRKIS